MAESSSAEVTRHLNALRAGNGTAAERLMGLVYGELRCIAEALFRNERAGHTLEPTGLVHEAYLRLVRGRGDYENRKHFYRVAAMAMRQLLMDYARDRRRDKRGGNRDRVTLGGEPSEDQADLQLDLLALDEALSDLARLSARQARVVELRFLAGLSSAETAEALGVTERTVYHDWRMARFWLEKRLSDDN